MLRGDAELHAGKKHPREVENGNILTIGRVKAAGAIILRVQLGRGRARRQILDCVAKPLVGITWHTRTGGSTNLGTRLHTMTTRHSYAPVSAVSVIAH